MLENILQNITTAPIETLAPGITFERLHDGQIHAFMLSDISRVTIDAWTAKIKEIATDWTNERPFMAVTVLAGKYLHLTPYLRIRMQEISKLQPDIWAFTAVVFPKSFFTMLMTNFVPKLKLRNTQTQFFHTREEALSWLEVELAESKGKRPAPEQPAS
jgi:hypothetical protein